MRNIIKYLNSKKPRIDMFFFFVNSLQCLIDAVAGHYWLMILFGIGALSMASAYRLDSKPDPVSDLV